MTSPETAGNKPALPQLSYPVSPELAASAFDALDFVEEAYQNLEDVFADLPDETIAEVATYSDESFLITDKAIPLLGGWRMLNILEKGSDRIDEVELTNLTFDGTVWTMLSAANTVSKLKQGMIPKESIEQTIDAIIGKIASEDTQFPTALRMGTYLQHLLRYLTVSFAGFKPQEIAQYASRLHETVASAQRQMAVINTDFLERFAFSELTDPNEMSLAMRTYFTDRIGLPKTSHLISAIYIFPMLHGLQNTVQDIRTREATKRATQQEYECMAKVAAKIDVDVLQWDQAAPKEVTTESPRSLLSLSELPIDMQLDWEILPPGSDLTKIAQGIVERSQLRSKKPLTIDLNRMRILQNIAQLYGENTVQIARGSLKERKVITVDGMECPDEYILVVIPQRNEQTQELLGHSVVADSPIVGPHAMYVYRSDTAQQGSDWETVFRVEKPIARRLGARAVRHRVPQGAEMVDTMTSKALELLTCAAADFKRIQFNGLANPRILKVIGSAIGGEFER